MNSCNVTYANMDLSEQTNFKVYEENRVVLRVNLKSKIIVSKLERRQNTCTIKYFHSFRK